MANLIERLIDEHRRLNALTGEMAKILTGLKNPVNPAVQEKFRGVIDPLVELLKVHDELETRELFPLLRKRVPEANQWQIRMVEVQDEMISAEARHFQELFAGGPSSVSAERIKESGAHLVRWIGEHIMMEEQNLFTLIGNRKE